MYACLCKGLTEADIQRAIGQAGSSSAGVIAALGLNDESVCGRCPRDIDDLLAPTVNDGPSLLPALASSLVPPPLARSGAV